LRFVFGRALFVAGLVLLVRVERGRITCHVEGVRTVQVCGSQRDRGGVLDLDVQVRGRREDAIDAWSVRQGISSGTS